MSNPEFMRKMQSVYGNRDSISPDFFGRRPATPKEIESRLRANRSDNFSEMEPNYPPDNLDLNDKGDEEDNFNP